MKTDITLREALWAIVDIAAVLGIVFLAYNGKDGWGWLLFYLIIKNC